MLTLITHVSIVAIVAVLLLQVPAENVANGLACNAPDSIHG